MRPGNLRNVNEAYRLERLREAMKRPRPAEWKHNQREGVRRAMREGRIKWQDSIKRAQAAARAANTGKKRPPEVVEKIRLANMGKKRSPEACKKYSLMMKARCAAGWRPKVTPEARRRGALVRSLARAGHKNPAHSQRMTGRKRDPEAVRITTLKNTGRVRFELHSMRGSSFHAGARTGTLRSPTNQVYQFSNLNGFVLSHPDLFNAEDVMWRKRNGKDCHCRASKGLSSLFAKAFPRLSWKGWTLSNTNRVDRHPVSDLLNRQTPVWDAEFAGMRKR